MQSLLQRQQRFALRCVSHLQSSEEDLKHQECPKLSISTPNQDHYNVFNSIRPRESVPQRKTRNQRQKKQPVGYNTQPRRNIDQWREHRSAINVPPGTNHQLPLQLSSKEGSNQGGRSETSECVTSCTIWCTGKQLCSNSAASSVSCHRRTHVLDSSGLVADPGPSNMRFKHQARYYIHQ